MFNFSKLDYLQQKLWALPEEHDFVCQGISYDTGKFENSLSSSAVFRCTTYDKARKEIEKEGKPCRIVKISRYVTDKAKIQVHSIAYYIEGEQ